MKNGKSAGPLGLVSEMAKAAGVAGVGMITDLVNRIIAEGVIRVVLDLNLIVNCYNGNGDSAEKRKLQWTGINRSDSQGS